MITGTVSLNREPIIRISVQDAQGRSHERNAVLDTGFNGWLTLPPESHTRSSHIKSIMHAPPLQRRSRHHAIFAQIAFGRQHITTFRRRIEHDARNA